MSDIRFSVSMCVYKGDKASNFNVALKSVFNQTLKPNEIVLVVDGPINNEIVFIINKYIELSRTNNIEFNVIRLEENVGHGEARRVCLSNCSHDWIALMDADDISVNNRFEKQIEYIKEHNNISVLGGQITEFLGKADANDYSESVGKRIVPCDDQEIKEYMKKRCPMNQVTVMFRKSDVQNVGGYQDWFCEEDYYLWIRLAQAKKVFGNLSDELVLVRVDDNMYQRRGGFRYFCSEEKLQRFMRKNGMISFVRYIVNVTQRLVLQVLAPNSIRKYIFQNIIRT